MSKKPYDLESEEILESYVSGDRREEINEGRAYGYSTNIRRIIWCLEVGDEVTVETVRKGSPTYELVVTESFGGEEAIAVSKKSQIKYYLIPAYYGANSRYDGRPWLRTEEDWESRGEINWIRVSSLV